MNSAELAYYNYTGYVTQEYVTEWQDEEGTRWRKRCVVINLGRADRVPNDPDAALQPERLDDGPPIPHWSAKGTLANVEKGALRQAATEKILVEFLTEYGPSHVLGMVDEVDYSRDTLNLFLRARPKVFCIVGMSGKSRIWGLVGLHNREGA